MTDLMLCRCTILSPFWTVMELQCGKGSDNSHGNLVICPNVTVGLCFCLAFFVFYLPF